jgi:hypothetical protein
MTVPAVLLPVISQLEDSPSQEEFTLVINQLKSLTTTLPELHNLLKEDEVKYCAQAKQLAKSLKEHYEQKTDVVNKAETNQSLSLDFESTENIKKELKKTFKENNICLIANGTFYYTIIESEIGLDDPMPPTKFDIFPLTFSNNPVINLFSLNYRLIQIA